MALWRGPLPDGSGINNVLRMAHHGRIPQRWFTVEPQGFEPALRFRLATFVTVAASHVFGSPIPWPEAIPLDQPREIVQWVIRTLEKYGACLVLTQVSRALRICLAARERGADLTGLTLLVGGEPLSPGKFRGITRSGARCVPNYSFAEFGRIGMPCSLSAEPTDVHLLKDALALITHPRTVPGSDEPIHPFCFTTLMPTAPKIMLNVEIDDYGVVEERACGCPMGELGFDVHLRHIHSFSKLTGEGMTLVGSEMVHLLDEVLPARFGGSALDYQLLEEEDREGFTRLSLLVDPRVALQDEQLVVDTMLKALSESSLAADLAGAVWRQAQTIRVKRMTPIWTARGKHFPLRPLKSR